MEKKPKTLFIENAIELNREYIETMEFLMNKKFVFDEVVTSAFSNGIETLDAIIRADEIYCETAFIGESAQLLDALVYHCLELKVKGKKLFVFREQEALRLYNLHRPEAFKKLLKHNSLYCIRGDEFELIDPKTLDI